MRYAAFAIGARLRPTRSAMGRDLAAVLPSTALNSMLTVAATVIAIFGLLDLLHYWPL